MGGSAPGSGNNSFQSDFSNLQPWDKQGGIQGLENWLGQYQQNLQTDLNNLHQQQPPQPSPGFTGTVVNPTNFGHEPVQFPNTNFTGQGSNLSPVLAMPPQPAPFPSFDGQQAQQTQQGALTGMPLFQGFNNVSSASTFNGPQNPTTPFANAVTNVLGKLPGS